MNIDNNEGIDCLSTDELRVLYQIGKLFTSTQTSLDAILEQIVQLMPHAWPAEQRICIEIFYNKRFVSHADFDRQAVQKTFSIAINESESATLNIFDLNLQQVDNAQSVIDNHINFLNVVVVDLGEFISQHNDLELSQKKYHNYINFFDILDLGHKIATMGYWEYNLNTGEIFWSDGLFEVFGYKPQEFELDFDFFEKTLYPEDRQVVQQAINDAIENHKNYEVVYRGVKSNNEVILIHCKGVVEYDEQDQPVAMRGTGVDITLQEKIKENDRYTRNIIETSLDPLITISEQGAILDVNTAMEAMTGVERKQLLGSPLAEYFTEPKILQECFQNVLHHGFIRDSFLKLKHVDGSITPVSFNASVYKDRKGRVAGIFAAARDITKQFVAEKKLIKARDEAERANYSKSEFLAKMSHELRTPLHGILSFAQFGIRNSETANREKLHGYFENIQSSGARLLVLLNDLLDLSKLEAGQMELKYDNHDLKEIVEQCISSQASRISERNLTIRTDIEDLMIAQCDEFRIGQVVANLLSNAIKFSQSGKTICIGLSRDFIDGKPALLFSIADQGVGIPENELEKVFDKFAQGSKTPNNETGTGLGLAISQEIIDLHRGKIWAEAKQGGALFKFLIPECHFD